MKKEIYNVFKVVFLIIILTTAACSQTDYSLKNDGVTELKSTRTVQVFGINIEGEKFICPSSWRSKARESKSGYISTTGKSYTALFTPPESGTYGVNVRYSNDNIDNLPTENLYLKINNDVFTVIETEDTGNSSFGWNNFVTTNPAETVSLVADEIYELKTYLLSGDNYGVEVDYIDFYKIPTITNTLEGESFIDPDKDRSAASKKLTGLIEDSNLTYSTRFFTETSGDFNVSVVYSNDNNGPTENVLVNINGVDLATFNAIDTGDYGHGWNSFRTHNYTEVVTLSSTQINNLEISYTNGDGFGIEIDCIKITPYVPIVIIGERMVAANHISNPPSILPYFDWSVSEYHAGVHPGDAGAWSHSGDYVRLDFNVETAGNYIMTLSLEYSGAGQPSEDLIVNINGARVRYIPDNNAINGYTTYSFPVNNLGTGRKVLEFIGPNDRQSVHIPWYKLQLQ